MDISKFRKKNFHLLINVQPWNFDLLKEVSHCRGIDNPLFISNFPQLDQSCVISKYQMALASGRPCLFKTGLSDSEIHDIIIRCRLLRELPYLKARNTVKWLAHFVLLFLNEVRPSCLLSEVRDQFFHDILFRLSGKAGIKICSLVPSMLNGYCRITLNGLASRCRDSIDPGEVSTISKMLISDTYVPDYLPRRKSIQKLFYKNHALNVLRLFYFSVARLHPRYRFTYHYWSGQINLVKNALNLLPIMPSIEYVRDIGEIKNKIRKTIFVPLHFYPEATTDYWCDVSSSMLYPERLEYIINQLSPHFDIVIKEHPSSIGNRKHAFYQIFNSPGVWSAHPLSSTRNLLDHCDAVLIWSGSVGIEAIIKGKPIIYASNKPYYDCFDLNYMIGKSIDIASISCFIDQFVPIFDASPDFSNIFFRRLLESHIPARFRNDGTFDSKNQEHLYEAEVLAKYLVFQ